MDKKTIIATVAIVLSFGAGIWIIAEDNFFNPLNNGRSEEQNGNYAKAVEIYTDSIKKDRYKNDPRLYLARARCQVRQERLTEAIADLDKALALAQNNSSWTFKSRKYGHSLLFDIWYDKAWAHFKKGELAASVDLYTKALNEQTDEHVLHGRALAYKKLGMLDKAEADLSNALKQDSQFEDAWHEHAVVMMSQGRKEQAISDLTEAIRVNRCPAAYFDRGIVYKEDGKIGLALADFTSAIKEDPKMERAYHSRALIEFDRGEVDKARADIKKAEELDPACPFLAADKTRILKDRTH